MTAKELTRKSEQQETTQLVDESKRECKREQRKSKDKKSKEERSSGGEAESVGTGESEKKPGLEGLWIKARSQQR